MELNVVRLGKSGNPVVIVLHGWGHNIEVIRPLGELLADSLDVRLIDLPGHGKTPPPEEVWGMEQFARVIVDYLDRNGIPQADFVGHSFGGKTSIKLAAMFPERVRRLVLINSSGLVRTRTFKEQLRFKTLGMLRTIIKKLDRYFNLTLFEKWYIPRFASPDYLSAGPLRQTFVKTVNEELSGEASSLSVPTLLVWGELDTETPLASGMQFKRLIPKAELVVLKGKGHVPFLDTGAHLCMFHIKQFFEKHPVSGDTPVNHV